MTARRRGISRSIWRKVIATLAAVTGFVLLYQATIHDSRSAREAALHDPTLSPMAGSRLQFSATAYCKGTTTASGVNVRTGIAAADPALLPVGSVVTVSTRDPKYNGVYTIMDTGPKVQGRILDVYMWSCTEALNFGRKDVQVTVLRLGWNPRDSTPSLISTLFRRRESNRAAAESPKPAATSPEGSPGAAGMPAATTPVVTEGQPPASPELMAKPGDAAGTPAPSPAATGTTRAPN